MSNYYEYRSIKAAIAERLMTMDGWKVYGYHPDNSDPMTDYFDPAYWGGIAEKNGYILCVGVYRAEKEHVLYEYTKETGLDYDKLRKLEAMTVANGASWQEEFTAKKAIEKIKAKAVKSENEVEREIGRIPAHMAHPTRCNWHIEKDGVYIAKGTGILQMDYGIQYEKYPQNITNREIKTYMEEGANVARRKFFNDRYYNSTSEQAWKDHEKYILEKIKSIKKYESWIHKVDVTCGGMVGKGKTERYEKQTKTIYKEEFKPVETTNGNVAIGQCFMLKSNFTYGCNKGSVYRIAEIINGSYIRAYKLNKKYTKECRGTAARGNVFNINADRFNVYIKNGSLVYCNLEKVKTPYKVEKVVKVTDDEPKATEAVNSGDFTIQESMHTKTGEKIWLVKCTKELSRDEYVALNKHIKKIGGYYSRFVHAFVFKENPSELLKGITSETIKEAC